MDICPKFRSLFFGEPLLSKEIEMLGETELMKYTVQSWSIETLEHGICVTIVLGRKILNAFLTTYLPTILLMIIIHSTNYYKDFFFEAIVTVNLTGMLVLCTMFVSVSGNLPVTSDIKMIEVWLIFSLMVPFTEVLLQVSHFILQLIMSPVIYPRFTWIL